MKGVSLVVPVYNEEESVVPLYREMKEVMEGMQCPYELIFVDDGSSDRTVDNLLRAAGRDPQLRIVQFRRNFGQTAAMAAGLDHSRFDSVVTLDGDLQNDPAEIPRMIAKLEEGYDFVAGWRKDRKDKFLSRRLPSMIANWIISIYTRVKLHDYGCSLKAMTGEVAHGIKLYGEMHRFIPALADEMGAKIIEMPVNHRARKFGQTKYGISRTIRVILDLITVKFLLGYSKRPIHLFGSLGLLSGMMGMLILIVLTYQKLVLGFPIGNRPILSLGVMLVIIGFQFLVFGLLGEVLARTYYESQDKKIYVVRRYIENLSAHEDRQTQRAVHESGDSTWNRKVAN
jgi:glycosyltransferase involved in cell wall biosynthesis